MEWLTQIIPARDRALVNGGNRLSGQNPVYASQRGQGERRHLRDGHESELKGHFDRDRGALLMIMHNVYDQDSDSVDPAGSCEM